MHFVPTSPFVHPVKGQKPPKTPFPYRHSTFWSHIIKVVPLFDIIFQKVLHLLASLSKRCSKKWSTYVYTTLPEPTVLPPSRFVGSELMVFFCIFSMVFYSYYQELHLIFVVSKFLEPY